MSLDLVSRLMRGARWATEGSNPAGHALALVPELMEGLPAVDPGPGDRPVTLPVACTQVLAGSVERVIRASLDAALADLRPEADDERAARLQTDALTQALRRVIAEGASVSTGGAAMAGLELARLSARHLATPGSGLSEPVKALRALPPYERGRALARVADELQARLAAACLDLARHGVRVPALLTRLAASPLPWVFDRSVLPSDVLLLAGALAVPVPVERLQGAVVAFDRAAGGVLERLAGRRGTPEDHAFGMRFCAPRLLAMGVEAAVASLRVEADAWTALLPRLSRFVGEAELRDAGIAPELAADLLRPEVGVGFASTLHDALRAYDVWEVYSLVIAAIGPAVEGTIERRFLVPRSAPAVGTVVAVSLGAMRAAVAEPVALAAEVDQAVAGWGASVRNAAIWAHAGECALFVFAEPLAALRFALSLRNRPAAGLPVPGASVAHGEVNGGTDGGSVRVSGAAVNAALRRLPHAAHGAELPPVLAPVGLEEGVLAGEGVVLDASVVDALRALGLQAVQGARPAPVTDAWDVEAEVIALVPVAGVSGAYNASAHAEADWVALAAAPALASPVVAVPGATSPALPSSAPPPAASPPPPASPSPAPTPSWPTSGGETGGYEVSRTPRPSVASPPPRASSTGTRTSLPPAASEAADDPASASSGGHEVRRPRPAATPAASPPDVAPKASTGPLAAPAPDTAGFLSASAGSEPSATTSRSGDPFAGGGDPFASGGDPFGVASGPSAAAPSGDPFGFGPSAPTPAGSVPASVAPVVPPPKPPAPADDLANIFGVPVGDRDAPPPTAPPPAFFEGAVGFGVAEDVSDSPSAMSRRLEVANEGFSVPRFEGEPHVSATTQAPARPRKAPAVDFGFLLNGYAVFVERERVVFGRPYGTRLIDLHAYDTGGNLDRAYQMFVQAKIREGFIPQTELTGDLPRGVTVMPLDLDRVKAAWSVIT